MPVEATSIEEPAISVVIPAHNAADTLRAQLDALVGQDYAGHWDVVVVDNRSTDATAAIAQSYAARLRLRVVPAGAGASVAYARNVGGAAATGELLVFLDADDVAAPGLLAAYARGAARFEVMGGLLDDVALNDPVTASWRYRTTEGALPVAFERFPYFIGANCAVRRRVFEALGGFDEELVFVGEDVDFSIRAQLAGHEVGWVPDAVVHYRHRHSIAALASQYYIYGRGAVVLFQRYQDDVGRWARLAASAHRAALLAFRLPDLVRSRSLRGRWVMLASATAGQLLESVRRGVWYVG